MQTIHLCAFFFPLEIPYMDALIVADSSSVRREPFNAAALAFSSEKLAGRSLTWVPVQTGKRDVVSSRKLPTSFPHQMGSGNLLGCCVESGGWDVIYCYNKGMLFFSRLISNLESWITIKMRLLSCAIVCEKERSGMVGEGKALQVYWEARNKEGERTKKFPISHFVVFGAEVTYEM